MTGADVVREARTWRGVRYRRQGRSRDGVDCIGFPACVRRALRLPDLDVSGYRPQATDTAMLDFCRRHMHEVGRTDLQPGDVLVQVNGFNRHMAIVGDYPGGGLSVIHAYLPNKRVVECRLDDDFMRIVAGCFRFREIEP